MKINKMIYQHRRDFTAEMKCEFCDHIEINKYGYDDSHYHKEVIPNMKCKSCEKSTVSEGGEVQARATKYPEGFQI